MTLARFEDDPHTKPSFSSAGWRQPGGGGARSTIAVVAYIAGVSAPPEKRMGHAGAIIEGGEGDARSKVRRLSEMGVPVAARPSEIPGLIREVL